MKNLHIIGAGAWGTALALTAEHAGSQVTLYTQTNEQAESLIQTRENRAYLPGIQLTSSLQITANLGNLESAEAILIAVPTQHLQELCETLQIPTHIPVVLCAKGIEIAGNNRLTTEIAATYLSNPLLVLSGPNFAREVAAHLPAATTIAGPSEAAYFVTERLNHPYFRCYLSNDIIGVQVAGALKNVLSIACGIAQGMGLGYNAVAAFLSRGLIEMRRLGLCLGASSDTFMGLAGVGDLTLTCSSSLSRNFSLGIALGQGQLLKDILAQRIGVTEGIYTAKAIHHLSQRLEIHLPICDTVYRILHKDLELVTAFETLLNRPVVPEID